jgi:hypothetical protein
MQEVSRGTRRISLIAVGLLVLFAPASASAADRGSLTVVVTGMPSGAQPHMTVIGPAAKRTLRSRRQTLHGLRAGRYRLSVQPVTVVHPTRGVQRGASVLPATRHLTVTITAGKTTKVAVAYGAVVNPHVQALSGRLLAVIGPKEDPSGLVFAHGSSVPKVGTILTDGPSAALPAGLLARVVAITHKGPNVLVTLAAAAVSEAVPELSFEGSLQLHPAAGSSSQAGSEVPAEAASRHGAHQASGCSPPSLVSFGAHLDTLEVRQASLGAWPPQMKLTLAVRSTETLGVNLAAAGVNCDWDVAEIGPYSGAIPVGPIVIPVYATLPVKAGVHINGALQAGQINVASTTVAHMAAGFDENAATLSEQGTNVWTTGALSLTGSAQLSASIGLQAGIGIAKGANIHAEADFGPEFDWSSGANCELFVNLGSLSAGVKVLGKSLDTPSFTPFKLHLWKGCQPSPPPPPPPPPPQAPSPQAPLTFVGTPGTEPPPQTLGSYQMQSFAPDTTPIDSLIESIEGPTGPVEFDSEVTHVAVENGWNTWSNGFEGDVYVITKRNEEGALEATLSLPVGTGAFYLYAEPDLYEDLSVSATTQDGTTSGPTTVFGEYGAHYFGFYAACGSAVKTVTVTDGGEDEAFGVGEFGIAPVVSGC